MNAPRAIRALRVRFNAAQAHNRKLTVLLHAEQDRNRLLEARLADLQAANEGHYRAMHDGGGFEPTAVKDGTQ